MPNSEKKTTAFTEGLESPIQFCPGVGPRRAQLLNRLDVQTVRDLLWHFPRAYEDLHTLTPIRHLKAGGIFSVIGTVNAVEDRRPRRSGKVRSILNVVISDHSGSLNLTWFNQPYLKKKLQSGVNVLVHGKVEFFDFYLQMSAPKLEILDDGKPPSSGILPLYPLTEGLTQKVLQDAAQKIFERFFNEIEECLPQPALQSRNFPARRDAFRILHRPKPGEGAPTDIKVTQEMLFDLRGDVFMQEEFQLKSSDPESAWERARRRIIFEEFYLHQFILHRYGGRIKSLTGITHQPPDPDPFGDAKLEALDPNEPKHYPAIFVKSLPFAMTDDQRQVCDEIKRDLCSPYPMNRMLQGDVGSGKTVVSLYAMLLAVASGYQAAMMAPTDLLARQHYDTVMKFTHALPWLRLVFLSGRSSAKETNESLRQIKTGEADIVVGTHALFQERVEFARLGFAVVDEQHKFGVDQRQKLLDKGDHPDLLVATATPIPRTLSLSLFGDMEVSTIRQLPPGRPPIVTRWTHWQQEKKVWDFIDEKVGNGEQAYVVCPIIEPSEHAPNLPSTEDAFERLSQEFLPHRRVALLHGRHSVEEKSGMMEKMRAGEIDIVVATTVVEVGVDLPNATMMVVLGAERFGLSQLHQLRGRVGRGTLKSYCILITPETIAPYAQQRMKIMEKTRDGFLIAEEDLRLRGPGEFFGTRQSGHLRFQLADIVRDSDILQDANAAAADLYRDDPNLEHPSHQLLRKEVIKAYGRYQFHRPS